MFVRFSKEASFRSLGATAFVKVAFLANALLEPDLRYSSIPDDDTWNPPEWRKTILKSVFLTVFLSVFHLQFSNPPPSNEVRALGARGRTQASTSKGRERPPLFARPAARKATGRRSRPFLSCSRQRAMSTTNSTSKPIINGGDHQSARIISSGQAGIFSLRDLADFLPISISRGVLRRTIPSLFPAIPHGKPSIQRVRHVLP